jgi:hypothetical protein
MIMTPSIRRLALTAHIISSVGWLGAVGTYFALAISGLGQQTVSGSAIYPVMELMTRSVILPLSLASLLTGLVMGLGTTWGLFRHYWVIIKLILNLLSIVVLWLYMPSLTYLAQMAKGSLQVSGLRELQVQAIIHSGAALGVLVAATVLSVYKPRGITPYGWKKQ